MLLRQRLMLLALAQSQTIYIGTPRPEAESVTLAVTTTFHYPKASKSLQPYNNVKQLRKENRAREKRMRKMVPKGRR